MMKFLIKLLYAASMLGLAYTIYVHVNVKEINVIDTHLIHAGASLTPLISYLKHLEDFRGLFLSNRSVCPTAPVLLYKFLKHIGKGIGGEQ